MADISNSTSTASLGDVSFRLDPTRVSWSYSVKTSVKNTVGGKVVQIFGVKIGPMTLFGSFGQGGVLEQTAFYNKIRALMARQASSEVPTPLRFLFPARGWDMQVFIRSMRDPNASGDYSVAIRPTTINPKWSIELFIIEGDRDLKKVAQDDYLDRLADGIGWAVGDFNGPSDAATGAAQISSSNLLGDTAGGAGATAAAASGATGPAGNSSGITNPNAKIIYEYLTAHGLTSIQAAGFMGNMQAESGFVSNIEEKSGGGGYGIVQWTGSRRTNLNTFARSQNRPASDLGLQLDFLWSELNGAYLNSVLNPLKASTTLDAATRIVLTKFEIPADIAGNMPRRLANATTIYNSLGH